jgi:hypothetical protein
MTNERSASAWLRLVFAIGHWSLGIGHLPRLSMRGARQTLLAH